VTGLDWIIVGFTLVMALWGWYQGLIVGALSLVGFAAGAFLGARLGPLVLPDGSESPYAPLFALTVAMFAGGLLASALEVVGLGVRRRLDPRLAVVDGAGGAALLACVALGIAWIAGAVALQTPGARELRADVQRSAIIRELNERLPPSGALLNALARFDPFPRFDGPAPDVRAPDSAIARDPQVRAARRSVVRVLGTACGLGVQGSGWIVGDGLVVTNAHVVAGQDDTTIQVGGEGPRHDAEAVAYDPRNDLAILRASGVRGTPALEPAAAETGASAAVLGFPGNGSYDVQPARTGDTRVVVSDDSYGNGPVRRRVTLLRGLVRSGNSGGPLVDGAGHVVATIFAASATGGRSGYGVPTAVLQEALAGVGDGTVPTGPCAR
jgi:hypothetical protein